MIKISNGNKLKDSHPAIFAEIDKNLNTEIDIESLAEFSHIYIIFRCEKCDNAWKAVVYSRTKSKTGCRFCAGKEPDANYNLKSEFPAISYEWNYQKNKKNPEEYRPYSNIKVWWTCKFGHDFDAIIANRSIRNDGCRFCSNKDVDKDNNFTVTHPEVASEWDYVINIGLKPENYTYGSKERVGWICKKRRHTWNAPIYHRTAGTNCPKCSNQKTSRPQKRIESELKYIFNDVISGNKIENYEIDVLLPEIKIGIEYDGSYWHKDKQNLDSSKNKALNSIGIEIIRIRESPLEKISNNDIIIEKTITKSDMNSLVRFLIRESDLKTKHIINNYVKSKHFLNDKLYYSEITSFGRPIPNSIVITHPHLVIEWDDENNGDLKPEYFSQGCHDVINWKCKTDNKHRWPAAIYNRAKNKGCPFCAKQKPSYNYNLANSFPEIAKDWDYKKNQYMPEEFTPKSGESAYWQCESGHKEKNAIRNRVRNNGCKFCNKEQLKN